MWYVSFTYSTRYNALSLSCSVQFHWCCTTRICVICTALCIIYHLDGHKHHILMQRVLVSHRQNIPLALLNISTLVSNLVDDPVTYLVVESVFTLPRMNSLWLWASETPHKICHDTAIVEPTDVNRSQWQLPWTCLLLWVFIVTLTDNKQFKYDNKFNAIDYERGIWTVFHWMSSTPWLVINVQPSVQWVPRQNSTLKILTWVLSIPSTNITESGVVPYYDSATNDWNVNTKGDSVHLPVKCKWEYSNEHTVNQTSEKNEQNTFTFCWLSLHIKAIRGNPNKRIVTEWVNIKTSLQKVNREIVKVFCVEPRLWTPLKCLER